MSNEDDARHRLSVNARDGFRMLGLSSGKSDLRRACLNLTCRSRRAHASKTTHKKQMLCKLSLISSSPPTPLSQSTAPSTAVVQQHRPQVHWLSQSSQRSRRPQLPAVLPFCIGVMTTTGIKLQIGVSSGYEKSSRLLYTLRCP